MTNKEKASSFLQMVSSGRVRDAFDRFVHPDFRHHLGFFKGDRESYLRAAEENARNYPEKTYETLRSLEDRDMVAIHGKVTFNKKVRWSVMHIFRFSEGKIIESWEASQQDLKEFPNENGIF